MAGVNSLRRCRNIYRLGNIVYIQMDNAIRIGFHLVGLTANANGRCICIYGAAAIINAQGDFVQSITVVIGDFDLEFHICAAVDSAATILMNADTAAGRGINRQMVLVVSALSVNGDATLQISQIYRACITVAGYAIRILSHEYRIGVRSGICGLAVSFQCQGVDFIAAIRLERNIIV